MSKKFINWSLPIVEGSYGNITADDVLDYIVGEGLADTILPLVEKGRQPVMDSFKTKTGEYESKTIEYKELTAAIFGVPVPVAVEPDVMVESYKVSKSKGAPD